MLPLEPVCLTVVDINVSLKVTIIGARCKISNKNIRYLSCPNKMMLIPAKVLPWSIKGQERCHLYTEENNDLPFNKTKM